MRYGVSLVLLLTSVASYGALTLNEDAGKLTILEDGKPVLVYNVDPVDPPEGVQEHYRRSGYIHPLYDLDGGILTEDFPKDHYHHRGVFWAWPDSTLGTRKVKQWLLQGVRSHHGKWLNKEAGKDRAAFSVQNFWSFDKEPDEAIIQENLAVVVHEASRKGRAIDITLTLKNVSDEQFVLRGAIPEDKGYGGMSIRPDSTCKPLVFTTANGIEKRDALDCKTPWADVSFAHEEDEKGKTRGVAIFQHPDNPGYPHEGWIFRHYGFLGQSWPHRTPHEMKPGDAFTLKYRLYVHKGDAKKGKVEEAFDDYLEEVK